MAQVVVSRPPIAANPIPFPQGRTVAPFLQKLSEFINDTNNHDLIHWSESGDSFLIPDHEHFARSVLGKWFKHQNWSSFVRQLNTYGFKKIQHLRQGALYPPDADSEGADHNINCCQFAHVHFKRAQPELIHLIRRKSKGTRGAGVTSTAQTAQIQDEEGDDNDDTASMDLIHSRDTSHTHNPPPSGGGGGGGGSTTEAGGDPTPAQLFEIFSALKHNQSTLSAEIDTLKRSLHTLHQESIDTRKALASIFKFLARVFGGYVRTNPSLHQQQKDNNDNDMAGFENYNNNKAIVPHRGNRTARLMIEGGDPSQKKKENDDEHSRRFFTEVGSMNSPSSYDIPVRAQGIVIPPSDDGRNLATADSTITDSRVSNDSLTRVQSESGVNNHQTTKDTSTTSSTTTSASAPPDNVVETPYNTHQLTGYDEPDPDGLHRHHPFNNLTPEQFAQFWMSLPQNVDGMNDSLGGLHSSPDLMVPPPSLSLPLLPTATTMFDDSPIPEPNAGAGLGPGPGPKIPEGLISFNDTHSTDTTPPSHIPDPHGTLLSSSSPFDIDIPLPRTESGVELDLEILLNSSGGDTSPDADVGIWPDPMDDTNMDAAMVLGWGMGRIGDSSGSGMDVFPLAGIEGRRNAGVMSVTPHVGVTRPKRKSDAIIGEAFDSGGMGAADPKRRRV